MITYLELFNYMKRGLRNGSWFKLSRLQKALYRAALSYAKHKGKIVNTELITQLYNIIEKLLTPGLRILKRGFERARKLIEAYKKGYLSWCPQILQWLTDPNY
ncbi:MAG: hypothetical protein ACP5IZ_09370, partial [Thermoprotei archaeon]